jgi:quinoprotein glucose dehydrogenase
MKFTPLRTISLVIGTFIAISFIGGSAMWSVLGLAPDLTIEGEAPVLRPVPDGTGQGWTAYGGDKGGARYAAVAQITPDNVKDLEIAWSLETGVFEGREEARKRAAFESTPILVEGSLVFCTQFQDVIAVDPGNGTEKWRYSPGVDATGRPANQFTCRGVSYWQDRAAESGSACASRLYVGTVDSRLIALDARTGAPCAEFGEGGTVNVKPSMDLRWPGEYQITSAPAIIGDTVITGSAISDNLRTEAPLGTVHAFDARTGEVKWRFNPVPQDAADPAMATWADGSAAQTGHANVWSTISVDEARGLVFLPTSSPSPDYYGGNRAGDNRYANSVVALNGETGDVVWSFQTVHHDLWDFDLPAQPGLYTVWRDGVAHDVVAQVTKSGLLFVLDRDTGEPFLPVEARAVPQGAIAGEVASPTQPFPAVTPNIVPNTLKPGNAFGITLWDKLACAKQIRGLRRDGLFTPPTEQGTLAYPFQGGGANWGSTAYDPARNLLVVNMSSIGAFVKLTKKNADESTTETLSDDAEYAPMEGAPFGMSRGILTSPLGLPCTPPPWGVIAGINLDTGLIVWRQTIGTSQDLAPGGMALKTGTPNIGGPIITSGGLVFIGATMDDYLRAFDVSTGRELWKGRLPAGGQATPMTYDYDGRQYVVIAAGGHSSLGTKQGDSLVAFALPDRGSPSR